MTRFPLSLTVCVLALLSTSVRAQDWVDDWFDSSTTTSAGSSKSQQRGYYSAGAFQARRRMTNDFPVTVQPPKLSVGCGGVDLFLGGFSYLDEEYLVQKFERIIQAAPAFAFNMAMSNFCKDCEGIMNTMTQLTDYLNSIQINDCRMAKQIAAIPMQGDMSLFKDAESKAYEGLAIFSGSKKNTTDVQNTVASNDGASPVAGTELIAECPAVVRDVFGGGSVVANVADLTDLAPYADVLRGLIGDVQIQYVEATQQYAVTPIEPCPGNDPTDGFDLQLGKMEKRKPDGTCANAGMTKVVDVIEGKLTELATSMDPAGTAKPTPEMVAFVNGAPIPILAALRDAVRAGNVDDVIAQMREPLTAAYAAKILNDLHTTTRLVLGKALDVRRTQGVASSTRYKCDMTFLQGGTAHLEAMEDLAFRYREAAKANYAKLQQEITANYAIAQQLMQQRNQYLNKQASPSE